jgi:hypothetical protein
VGGDGRGKEEMCCTVQSLTPRCQCFEVLINLYVRDVSTQEVLGRHKYGDEFTPEQRRLYKFL